MNNITDNIYYKTLEARNFLQSYTQNSAVSISGGKDSLVVLDISLKVGLKNFVFCNTSLTFPGTAEYLINLEKFYQIKITEVKPPREFFDLVNHLAFPSQRLRWCCEVYKFGPLSHYVLKNKIKYLITGLRSQESRKRKDYLKVSKNPLIPAFQINPILHWSIEDVWEYINHLNLPYNPLYDKGYERLGCWMCPFQKREGFERLKKHFKPLYSQLEIIIRKNIEKFDGITVRNIDDYINNYAWTKNALPIKNIIKGFIEFRKEKNSVFFRIKSEDLKTFSKLKGNIKLLKEKSINFIINETEKKIEFLSSHLDIKRILIYCEKQVNCVGCGACRSLCNNSAISIVNNQMKIDFLKCKYCLDCLRSNKLRAGCVARNYSPIRYKFNEYNMLNNEVSYLRKKFKEINLKNPFQFKNTREVTPRENLGLIKTRKSVSRVLKILDHYFKDKPKIILKTNQTASYAFDDFIIFISTEKGFTLIDFKCWNHTVNENINFLMKILDK